MNIKNNKKMYYGIAILGLLIISFLVYGFIGRADTNANKIAMNKIKMTGITTGTGKFTDDGLNYADSTSYTKTSGYTAGNDSNGNNRIVRSFDTLTYHFDYSIKGKNDSNDYEDRSVNIKVTIPDSISKYVTFDPNEVAGQNTHTYTFSGIDTYGTFKNDITLYVLGAPNGTEINPTFEIQESTNNDGNYLVTLGNAGNTNNYEYDIDSSSKYSTTSSVQGFSNYMPTVVSSKTANVRFKLLNQTNEGQKATYDNKTGRYLTYVLGVELVGDDESGIKGYTMPKDDISFNINSTQNGNTNSSIIESGWLRTYGNETISSIEPISVSLPYSSGSTDQKVKAPGKISLTGNSVSISGYDLTYNPVRVNADGSSLSNAEHVIGTYAITAFSQRNADDLRNDITNSLTINNISLKDTTNANIPVDVVSSNIVNKYYENVDYSLNTEILNEAGEKLADKKGQASTSKGTTTMLRTTFNYNKTLSDQGLKEVIKIDPNAFRFIPSGNKDINIKIESPDNKLTENDFEIKYVSGDFNNSNYSVSSIDSRLNPEDLSLAQSSCPNNISSLSNDQIMNLYGGPCIKANANSEEIFDSIASAKTADNKEIPITKVVVQTKKGITLPDNVKITIDINVRVRNVSDITRTYQMTTVASSSDYDSTLTYYSPRITNDENSITNPNNYKKTVYAGNDVPQDGLDKDSPWGDTLKIVNFTSRQVVSVKNKNADGSMKLNYNVNSNTTLNYNIKTIISDNNEQVGADDTWFINHLRVYVTLPEDLIYVKDKSLGNPEVIDNAGQTILVYTLPYTKPNMKIGEINFKAIINPKLKGSRKEITVTSRADAININGEKDTSYFDLLSGSLRIYATGIENVIVSQKVGEEGSVIEKNGGFSYILSAYNNTDNIIEDYSILDILPSNNDKNGSKISGTYKVKVTLPSSQGTAKVYCSTKAYNQLTNEVLDSNNEFKPCNATSEYVDATAIRIDSIKLNKNSQMDDIKVSVKTNNNTYDDKYINSFAGASETYSQNESNKIEVRVVSRNISGRVFIDSNDNGIEDEKESHIKDIPLTLYKLDTENKLTEIENTVTNEEGKYIFKNLDVGRYKIRASYNKEAYDLALRYATIDTAVDSDAYKISEGVVEISNKRIPNESDGIKLTREIETADNMNIGLVPRSTFGFNIDKFITKVDLTYNNTLETHEYLNQKLVKEDVRSSLNAYAKVYYGIRIDNKSTSAGYVKLINENIPNGAVFDSNDPINKDWFYTNGQLQNISLANDLIEPGDSRYLTIALNIPPQKEYRSYVNTVTILDIEPYNPQELAPDTTPNSNTYEVGEAVTYAGVNWHVIGTETVGDEQHVTLLADSDDSNMEMAHTTTDNDTYKWSDSLINKYINSSYLASNNLNTPILIDNSICDDASGLPVASYGGTLRADGTCQSGVYTTSKVRLLTEAEFGKLTSSETHLSDLSWLYGNKDFWLQNSVFVPQDHDVYGRINDITVVKNLAKFLNKNDGTVQTGYSTNKSEWKRSNLRKEVRPVITISNKNIIAE